jgi:hypothetical protein
MKNILALYGFLEKNKNKITFEDQIFKLIGYNFETRINKDIYKDILDQINKNLYKVGLPDINVLDIRNQSLSIKFIKRENGNRYSINKQNEDEIIFDGENYYDDDSKKIKLDCLEEKNLPLFYANSISRNLYFDNNFK